MMGHMRGKSGDGADATDGQKSKREREREREPQVPSGKSKLQTQPRGLFASSC